MGGVYRSAPTWLAAAIQKPIAAAVDEWLTWTTMEAEPGADVHPEPVGDRLVQVGEHLLILGGRGVTDEDIRRLRLSLQQR